KSSLFNQLTHANVFVADQLFATLDPTMRQLKLPGASKIVLADTVGFIRHLPHDLIEAFGGTLEETRDASLLLTVIDTHDPDRRAHAEQAQEVLIQIGADQVPILEVYNKIDLLTDPEPRIDYDQFGKPVRVHVSAVKNIGIDSLVEVIA